VYATLTFFSIFRALAGSCVHTIVVTAPVTTQPVITASLIAGPVTRKLIGSSKAVITRKLGAQPTSRSIHLRLLKRLHFIIVNNSAARRIQRKLTNIKNVLVHNYPFSQLFGWIKLNYALIFAICRKRG
jgi:hypothetical protein